MLGRLKKKLQFEMIDASLFLYYLWKKKKANIIVIHFDKWFECINTDNRFAREQSGQIFELLKKDLGFR